MELINQYFPELPASQQQSLEQLGEIYRQWNERVNLISRKDMDHFYERHVLHSLAIAKFLAIAPGTTTLDVGTGGGFPGIPLAILFPEASFTLVDSIGKKVKVVQEVADQLALKNLKTIHARVEDLNGKYDYVVSRAVAPMPKFVGWTRKLLHHGKKPTPASGIWYLKGGDLTEELKDFKFVRIYDLSDLFAGEFFETKKLVHLPASGL